MYIHYQAADCPHFKSPSSWIWSEVFPYAEIPAYFVCQSLIIVEELIFVHRFRMPVPEKEIGRIVVPEMDLTPIRTVVQRCKLKMLSMIGW